jgi:hypothetical protein
LPRWGNNVLLGHLGQSAISKLAQLGLWVKTLGG